MLSSTQSKGAVWQTLNFDFSLARFSLSQDKFKNGIGYFEI